MHKPIKAVPHYDKFHPCSFALFGVLQKCGSSYPLFFGLPENVLKGILTVTLKKQLLMGFLFPSSSVEVQDEMKLCFDTCHAHSLNKTLSDLYMRFYYN